MNYVNIENLSFSYDDKKIFSNVNMQIRKGDFISILSSNSSGKTTFLRLIKGLLNYNGTITVDNKEISIIKENICLLTPFTESYSKTILDELLLITNDIVKIKKILKDFDLYDEVNKSTQSLSYFDNQKLNIIKCILKNPKLILIDSIFSFLNKHEKLKIFSMIKKYQLELNLTIIFTTVNLEDILFSDSVYIINNKKISLISMEDLFTSKIIKDNHINIPVFYELKDKLKLYNLISDNVSIIDEMVDEICR